MAFTSANDINILQPADQGIIDAGAGDDIYILSGLLLEADQTLTISDTKGDNSLQLIDGLEIANSQVTSDAFLLTLFNGAEITLLGASAFSYSVGGNLLNGTPGLSQDYADFVTDTLGLDSVPVPDGSTVANGGSVSITAGGAVPGTGGADVIAIPLGINTVVGTTGADRFYFNVKAALADLVGGVHQSEILNFTAGLDTLVLDMATADPDISTLAELADVPGVSVQPNVITGDMLINLGNDANGGQVVTLSLIGATEAGAIGVEVI